MAVICGSCRDKALGVKYHWTSDDGTVKRIYNTESGAKVKVNKKGGSYIPVPKAGQ